MKQTLTAIVLIGCLILLGCTDLPNFSTMNTEQDEQEDMVTDLAYSIVDTGQDTSYNNRSVINTPLNGDSFYGQDANFQSQTPSYRDNSDGTVTDLNTGLMWQQDPGAKMSYDNAAAGASSFNLAGYSDWRLPTIKELYSLILFSGIDPNITDYDLSNLTPFINRDYFVFSYGDESAGERIIDSQYVSSNKYVSTTMNGDETAFGVNFADGRIKGYPVVKPGGQGDKLFFVLYVRGNPDYGKNDFKNNGDGTVTDRATGLMWSRADNATGLDWQAALAWVVQKNSEKHLGYSDWRLPDAKELQSIVDYTRSPATSDSAAIDPIFKITRITDEGGNGNYPCFWSGTTHTNQHGGNSAAYVAFGEALGWMSPPWGGDPELMDVHGAGAQRSDPKSGDAAEWPYGRGLQGDVIRINNFVRLVRTVDN